MRRWALLVLPVLVLAYGCTGGHENQETGPVQSLISNQPEFKEWQSLFRIGTPEFYGVDGPAEHPLAWISPIQVGPGPRNSIIVLEDRTPDIKVLYPGGEVLSLGRGLGSGPAEFRDLFGAAWNEQVGILIADGPNQRITLFTEDGEYVRDLHPETTCDQLALSGTRLWATAFAGSIPDRVFGIDVGTGDVQVEVGGLYTEEPWANSRFSVKANIAATDSHLFVSVSYPYEIQEYDNDGKLIAIFGRRVDWLGPPEEMDLGPFGTSMAPKGGTVGRIAVLPDGRTMVQLYRRKTVGTLPNGLPDIESTMYYDIFSAEGRWLTTIPGEALLPGARTGAWTIASDGAFWSIVWGDFPRIARVPLGFVR